MRLGYDIAIRLVGCEMCGAAAGEGCALRPTKNAAGKLYQNTHPSRLFHAIETLDAANKPTSAEALKAVE